MFYFFIQVSITQTICVIIVIYDLCVSDHIMLDCILGGLSLL